MTKSFGRAMKNRTLAAAFALAALTLLAPAARAQWATNSANDKTTTDDAVGVGTAAPDNALVVQKDQAYNSSAGVQSMTQVQVRNDNGAGFASFSIWSGGGSERGRLQFNAASPNIFLTSRGAIPLYLGTNDTVRVTVDGNTGNVGVGTFSPANALHVHNANTYGYMRVSGVGLGAINFQDTGAAQNKQLYQWRSEGGRFRMALSNDAGTALVRPNILVADDLGKVGFGTDTPAARFDVRQNSGANATLLLSHGANEDTYLRGGTSAAVIHIGDVAAAKLLLMESGVGSVGVGTPSPTDGYRLDVAGGIKVSHDAGGTGGNLTVAGTITGGTITATYQDVAEWVPSTQKLTAGTVVVLDAARTNHVLASATAYDTKVAGVVSAQPGVILGVAGDDKLKVATTGRVKVRVDASRGAIRVGDLLVTSEVEGVAMRSMPVDLGGVAIHRPGTIIGKALEPLEKGVSEILVLLSLQ